MNALLQALAELALASTNRERLANDARLADARGEDADAQRLTDAEHALAAAARRVVTVARDHHLISQRLEPDAALDRLAELAREGVDVVRLLAADEAQEAFEVWSDTVSDLLEGAAPVSVQDLSVATRRLDVVALRVLSELEPDRDPTEPAAPRDERTVELLRHVEGAWLATNTTCSERNARALVARILALRWSLERSR
jgi:hypothetical protein